MTGQRRAEAERSERRKRPLRAVAVAFLALILAGVIGSAFVSDGGSRPETVTVDGHQHVHEIDDFFGPGAQLSMIGVVLLLCGIGLVLRSFFWDTVTTRGGDRDTGGRYWYWSMRIGAAVASVGLVLAVVGRAIA